jgi:hypothetical protein
LLYYLLFVSLVTTPARLRCLLTWLVVCLAVMVGVTMLDHHRVIKLPRPHDATAAELREDEAIELDETVPRRMAATGLFRDPNDLCVIIGVGILLTLNELTERRWGGLRFLWLLPLVLFGYGFVLTRSRGGLLALLAGLGGVFLLRFGWRRTLLLGSIGVPVLLAVLGGRQAELTVHAETGQERIYLWSDGLTMLRAAPLFGIGANKFSEFAGHAAHNSYIHAFSELGFLGGLLYLGAFYLSSWGLLALTWPVPGPTPMAPRVTPVILDPQLRRIYPYVLGAVLVYATGQLSLSLNYVMPTYTIVGLAVAFLELAQTQPEVRQPRFDAVLLKRLAGVSLLFLVAVYVFIRLARS